MGKQWEVPRKIRRRIVHMRQRRYRNGSRHSRSQLFDSLATGRACYLGVHREPGMLEGTLYAETMIHTLSLYLQAFVAWAVVIVRR